MRPLARRLALACAILLPLAVQAAPFGYVSSFDRLYRVDLGNGQHTLVGSFRLANNQPVYDVEGLAFAPDGALYGVSDASEVLIRINTATGASTVVGNLGLAGQGTGSGNNLDFGLSFTCDGKLWLAAETARKLWEVTPATGATRLVGATGVKLTGLAARGNELFGIGASGDERLYSVDTATGATTAIGTRLGTNLSFDDGGLDFDADGTLWAVFDYRPTSPNRASDLARIDTVTGLATLTGGQVADDGEGLAIAPPVCAPSPPPSGGGAAANVPSGTPAGSALLMLLTAILGVLVLGRARRA